MKKYLLISVLLLLLVNAFGQTKPKQKEKPPTNKEMEEMMKGMQSEIDGMSAEDKEMMDSMGIKMPSMKDMPKVTDKQLATAFEEEGIVIPSKKNKLIALLPKNVLSKTQLAAYIKTTDQSIASMIKPEAKQMAEKVMVQFKNDKYYGALIASAANGMWVAGYKEAATYLMGKATEVLPNADNHNNFAAYLTMMGAAHMAIPVLEKLNSVHRKNSTVLNNLGQAWLQLGDVVKAEKYLDSTIMIYTYHPQANYTKCLILETKGKKAEATVALKRSLKHSVTKNKLKKLKDLEGGNYKPPKGYHIPKVYFSASFNLGLYTAIIPKGYAKTAGMAEENQWKGFREQLREEKAKLDAAIKVVNKILEDDINRISGKVMKQGGMVLPPYYEKAVERFNNYMQGGEIKLEREAQDWGAYLQETIKLKQAFTSELNAEKERYEMKTPNGENLAPNCAGELPIITKYITATNDLNQNHNQETVKRLVTEAYQFYQYSTDVALTDAAALKLVLEIKSDFLRRLIDLRHEYYGVLTECIKDKEEPYKKIDLPDYDEVNCQILNTINFPGLGSIIMRCNNMGMKLNPILSPVNGSLTANFDGYIEQASVAVSAKGVDIEMGGVFDKEGNFVKGSVTVSTEIKGIKISATGEADANGFTKGSVELGIDTELSFLPEGLEGESPVEISLKNELGMTMELGKEGITDMYVKDKMTGDVAANIEVDNKIELTPGEISNTGEVTDPEMMKLPLPKSPSISVSADNRWSVNSGHSVTGNLSGLTAK